jgi:hypothetical protein
MHALTFCCAYLCKTGREKVSRGNFSSPSLTAPLPKKTQNKVCRVNATIFLFLFNHLTTRHVIKQ